MTSTGLSDFICEMGAYGRQGQMVVFPLSEIGI